MRCQSASARSAIDIFGSALPQSARYSYISGRLLLLSLAVDSSDKPSAEVVCFSSARRSPGTLLHTVVLSQLSDARGKTSVSRSPPHRDDVSVRSHQVASRHVAGGRRREEARAFPSALLIIPLAN